jgi:recombination protein RecA
MPEAITTMLKVHGGLYDKQVRRERKSVATPDLPNRSVSQPLQDGEEQINSDRMPPRRGDNLNVVPGCAEPQPRRVAALPSDSWMPLPLSGMAAGGPATTSNLWQALDQALRATDLLLQNGGGFGAIVLDLGSVAPEFAWRIPLATWFRFRAACERTRVSLLVLTQHPCARSSAGLVLRLQPARMEAQNKVMTGVLYRAELERSRFSESHSHVVPIRKPPQPEHPGQWRSEAVWA